MALLDFFLSRKKNTANIAKERLQIIIARERSGSANYDFIPELRRELINVIAKYVNVSADDIHVKLAQQGTVEVLDVNVVLPDNVKEGFTKS